nr:NADH dehydrogenase subunit 4L [Paralipsa gularis]
MMIYNMLFIVIFMFMIGNMIFVLKRKPLLIVLLSLEFMVLSIFFFLSMYFLMFDENMYMLMVFLGFSGGEGALGLSILGAMIRTHGNDYIQKFKLL